MTDSANRSVLRAAGAAVLLVALGLTLSACGRKGPLDLPPGATFYDTPGAPAQPQAQQFDSTGRPVAPTGPNKRIPLDVLLD